jgi:hypothetical protein
VDHRPGGIFEMGGSSGGRRSPSSKSSSLSPDGGNAGGRGHQGLGGDGGGAGPEAEPVDEPSAQGDKGTREEAKDGGGGEASPKAPKSNSKRRTEDKGEASFEISGDGDDYDDDDYGDDDFEDGDDDGKNDSADDISSLEADDEILEASSRSFGGDDSTDFFSRSTEKAKGGAGASRDDNGEGLPGLGGGLSSLSSKTPTMPPIGGISPTNRLGMSGNSMMSSGVLDDVDQSVDDSRALEEYDFVQQVEPIPK